MPMLPRYPIFVPSKGRYQNCLTANVLKADGVPFKLVVEDAERDHYAARYGEDRVLVLPFSNMGSVIPARNWIKDYSTNELGAERHWQFDDNIRSFRRVYKAKRMYANAGPVIAAAEDFTDRYENIAVSGFNYTMFAPVEKTRMPPFYLNVHVYSATLTLNTTPHRWRGRYNEDTDYCLQVLADGWCTVLFNAFLVDKQATMKAKGGNTTELYSEQDGRLRMARALERQWPGVVETRRRYERPQHYVAKSWKAFDTPLKLKPDVQISDTPNEYGMELKELNEVRSPYLRRIVDEYRGGS